MRATGRKAPFQRSCEGVSCESVQSHPLFSHTNMYSTEDGWSIGRALRCASWKTSWRGARNTDLFKVTQLDGTERRPWRRF